MTTVVEETLTLEPSAEVTGTWQKDAALPVDAVGYEAPTVVAFDVAAYEAGDFDADGQQVEGLTLPDLGDLGTTDPDLITSRWYENETYSTTHNVPYPTDKEIVAGDLLILTTASWSDLIPNENPGVAGWTMRAALKTGGDYEMRQTIWWKIATGSESGTQAVTWTTGIPLTASIEVWRGVDNADPFSTDGAASYGSQNPNPAAITTEVDRQVVRVSAVGRRWNGDDEATVPTGYLTAVNTEPSARQGILVGYKLVETAGTEDPGAFDWNSVKSNSIALGLRPGTTVGTRALMVVASGADATESAALVGADCELAARDEIQTISSALGSGNFTLTYDGQTTGNIAWNATAATIESALEALSNIGSGDVRCSGGPLNTDDVDVEFIGALAGGDRPLMTTSSGSVTVAETVKGLASQSFTYQGDINIPRVGGTRAPQTFVWSLVPSTYVAGQKVTFRVADHDANDSFAAALLVVDASDTTDPIGAIGDEQTGNASSTDVGGSTTPSTNGARIIGVMAKAQATGKYSNPAGASTPARWTSVASAVADLMSLDLFMSAAVPSGSTPSGARTSWTSTERYATGTLVVNPATPPTASLDQADVVSTQDSSSWLDVAAAASNLYEVIEVDLSGLPSDAWIIGASVKFAHSADADHSLRVSPCAISADGLTVTTVGDDVGIAPSPLATEVEDETQRWSELGDGTDWNSHTRLGILLRSTATAPQLQTHKVFWLQLQLHVIQGGPVVSNVAGPSVAGTPITWDYSSVGGAEATQYRVLVLDGLDKDPEGAAVAPNPMEPGDGEISYDSGWVSDAEARSHSLTDFPLHRGNMTAAVKVRAVIGGRLVESEWDYAGFQVAGAAPATPTSNTAPYLDDDTGVVRMSIDIGADTSRAWLFRSRDSGATFELCETNPFPVGPTTTDQELYDDHAPMIRGTFYNVSVDDGEMTETSARRVMAAGAGVNAIPEHWYLIKPGDPDSNLILDVADIEFLRPTTSVLSQGPGGAAVASSDELGSRLQVRLRTLEKADREALDALLALDTPLRLTDIIGREWMVVGFGDRADRIVKVAPRLNIDETQLRDAFVATIELQEVITS